MMFFIMQGNFSLLTKQSTAFTLAELLIALAILGVISTFTIPKVLQAQQNSAWSTAAKETAAMVSASYQSYQLENTPSADTAIVDLTPYMNYLSIQTTGSIDNWQTATTATCSTAHPCMRLHNGGILRYKATASESGFGGTASTNAVMFFFDPDGKVTDGTTNGPGKGAGFFLYYGGRLMEKGTIYDSTTTEFSGYTPNPAHTPPWFSW